MNRNLTGHNGFRWTWPELRPGLAGKQTGSRKGGQAAALGSRGDFKDLNKYKWYRVSNYFKMDGQ